MPTFDPYLRRMTNGPEAGQNTEVDGFTVGFLGSTDGTVYNAGSGLTLSGNVFAADLAAAGYRLALNGGTVSVARYMPVETVTGSSVTMQAGHAYKITATSSAVTLNTETVPANQFGLEGHLEIFVAGTGYVVTGTNVVLSQPLEPDSVNNCTVRFHDGLAIISVEDHVAGYIVITASGTSNGSLYYGLATDSREYIAVDASLNGSTLDMAGAVTNGEKHVVGNGYAETILTGGVSCTSKTTFANLAMQGVFVLDGTAILGDVYIPNGATVSVSGGGLAVEKVTGNGGTIDLNGSNRLTASNSVMRLSGVSIENNTDTSAIYVTAGGSAFLNGVSFRNNTGSRGDIYMFGRFVELTGCTVNKAQGYTGEYRFVGSNTLLGTLKTAYSSGGDFSVTVASGATLDLTGNTNSVPVEPGGGITFASGGATVKYGEVGSVSSMFIDNATVNTIASGGVVNPKSNVAGAVFSGVKINIQNDDNYLFISNVNYSSCTFTSDCKLPIFQSSFDMTNCIGLRSYQLRGATVSLHGDNTITRIQNFTGAGDNFVNIDNGAIVRFISNDTIAATVITVADNDPTKSATIYPYGGGDPVSIVGGTYTQINADGTTE